MTEKVLNRRKKIQKIIEYEGDNEVSIRRMSNTIYRVGYCSQCGACCRNLDIQTQISSNVAVWLEGYGIKISKIPSIYSTRDEQDDLYTATLSIPIQCTYLKKTNHGTYECTRYDKRPVICIGYPKYQSKWETCTYVFLTNEELNWFQKEYKKYWENKQDGQKKERTIRMY